MNEKMVRFLSSIGIENIDDFDLDFDLINKNRFNQTKYDMIIVKDTPWKYQYIRQFQDALQSVTYLNSLRFSYRKRPNGDDVIELFNEWHQTLYHVPSKLKIYVDDRSVFHVDYCSNEEQEKNKAIITDFQDFLQFICYEFVILESIVEPSNNDPVYTKKEKTESLKDAYEAIKNSDDVSEADELPSTADIDSSSMQKAMEENRQLYNEAIEESILQEMRENKKRMIAERERNRINKRGNYKEVSLIDTITSNSDGVDFTCKIFSIDERSYIDREKKEQKVYTLGVVDNAGGCIHVKINKGGSFNDNIIKNLFNGTNIRVRGKAYVEERSGELLIRGHYIDLLEPDEIIPDEEGQTRVELHLHSNMSAQDGITSIGDYIKYAKKLGHTAIGLTDHGVVQSFPEAAKVAKKNDMKMLYGCEFYMVDDQQIYIQNPSNALLRKSSYVCLDLETTGLSTVYNKIIEFGAQRIENGTIVASIDILIDPEVEIPDKITRLTGIKNSDVHGQPTFIKALPRILDFIKDSIIVTHNAEFDFPFLQEAILKEGQPLLTNPVIDTLPLSRYMFPDHRAHNLKALCKSFEIPFDTESAHRADYDAKALATAWLAMLSSLTKDNPNMTHSSLSELKTSKEMLEHIRPTHVCVYAKNKKGLKSLYELVSLSHIEYMSDVPKILRSEISKRRENLLIGSACLNGDVFRNARYQNKEHIKAAMKFYDYIEIQPLENYSFLINMEECTKEHLECFVKDIVDCADELHIPVCATGDVHYLKKEDKIFRDVFIAVPLVGGGRHPLNPYDRKDMPLFENPDQYFRSTREMLECFSFLGEEKAKEIVITNTNKIADSIEMFEPIPSCGHPYAPKQEGCEDKLRTICYQRAHDWYGDLLPEVIQQRLDKELNGIISNGYSVIYYFAHQIVSKTKSDGFIVGSRGSVGSSFAATMAGITEVNPLKPHYRCPKCKHFEWGEKDHPEIRSGYDLPEKVCPICGEPMIHDGQNIPFETFLGFNAEKTPDIDLNFARDYQQTAHDYARELLGEKNVFRAGTIGTVAFKSALGYVRGDKGYLRSIGINPDLYPKAKAEYLASGCVGVKRQTGKHAGGVVVVPSEYDVNDFTPIQYPADEVNSSWKTTHFDFDSMHDTLLKFDLLGHLDPMALKMCTDLTGIKIEDIPLNDKQVLSLFTSEKALNLKRNYLREKTGSIALPEFGTKLGQGILDITKPMSFSDLIIVSGLAHGTNVWEGNAKTLIQEGVTDLHGVIGCRDDIMTYLISKNVPSDISFLIMEDVRHGHGLKEEYVNVMKTHNVPQYYIDSCNKIAYLFPKAHATAYTIQALRVGYFKVYYPLEFYASYFSVRSDKFDIFSMVKGEASIIDAIEQLKLKGKMMNDREKETLDSLSVALEMLQRGYSFGKINLYKSDATKFVVDKENNQLIPPFTTIDGLGEANAQTVIDERNIKSFDSIDELSRRTKLTAKNIDTLRQLGTLDGMSETDQISLFDFNY